MTRRYVFRRQDSRIACICCTRGSAAGTANPYFPFEEYFSGYGMEGNVSLSRSHRVTFICPLKVSFANNKSGERRTEAISDGRGDMYTAESVPGASLAMYFQECFKRLDDGFKVTSIKRNQIGELIVSQWIVEGQFLVVNGTSRMRVCNSNSNASTSDSSVLEAVQIEEIWDCGRTISKNENGIEKETGDFLSVGFSSEMIRFCLSRRAVDLLSIDPRSLLPSFTLSAWESLKDQPSFGADMVRGEADLIFVQAFIALSALFLSVFYFMLRVIQLSLFS